MNRLLVWYGELATTRKLTARGLALLAIPLLWIVVLLVAPLGAMVAWSAATRGAAGDIEWTFTLGNFARLAGFDAFGWTRAYLSILGSTLLVSAVTTLASIASPTPSPSSSPAGRPAGATCGSPSSSSPSARTS